MVFVEKDGGVAETIELDARDALHQFGFFFGDAFGAFAKAFEVVGRVHFGITRFGRIIGGLVFLALLGETIAFFIENGNANRLRSEVERHD